jgi:Protein of unknown function (DUF1513)
VTRCDGVTPRESVESRPIVTVLVTRLPHRGEQELDGHSFALADHAMDPTPLVVAGARGWATRVRIPDGIRHRLLRYPSAARCTGEQPEETLVVANGGYVTHPDVSGVKLARDRMRPSLALLHARDGQRLRLRHLAVGRDDAIAGAAGRG